MDREINILCKLAVFANLSFVKGIFVENVHLVLSSLSNKKLKFILNILNYFFMLAVVCFITMH